MLIFNCHQTPWYHFHTVSNLILNNRSALLVQEGVQYRILGTKISLLDDFLSLGNILGALVTHLNAIVVTITSFVPLVLS